MKYYQDITIIPCAEISIYHIWEKLYQQVHLALVESKDADGKIHIGVAFPKYQYNENCKTLGNVFRVFAQTKPELENLNLNKWLSRLNDYVHIKSIKPIPETNKFYSFWSPQPKGNRLKIARRNAKRKNITEAQALLALKDYKETTFDFPFINTNSLSKKERFIKFIKAENADTMVNNGFNSYGLSRQSSLPNF